MTESKGRREFIRQTVYSYALLQTLVGQSLFGKALRPIIEDWLREMNGICRDLRQDGLTQSQWQAEIGRLFAKVPMQDLLRYIDYEKLTHGFSFPDLGTATRNLRFPKIIDMPKGQRWFSKIFGLQKGRAIIPHGHKNMVSAHLVLNGEFELRHFDRVADETDHLIMKPTIHRISRAGDASSISDEKDNIHWFITRSETAFTFDLIMTRINAEAGKAYEIENIDPEGGERLAGNLLRVRKMPVEEALKKYGKEMHH